VSAPATKKAMMKSSNEKVKASSAPAITPGRISGSTTCRNVPSGVA
jgi:hypothetical protein